MIDYGFGVVLSRLDWGKHSELTLGWRNHPSIRAWCRQNDLLHEQTHFQWFERQAKDPSIQMYAVGTPGETVGVCGLTDLDLVNRRAEFSLYIGPEHQRKGFARAGLKTLLSHGFNAYGLNLIWGESFEGNPAMELFKSLGMKGEGIRRDFYFRDGKFVDAYLWRLLRREFVDRFLDWKNESQAQAPVISDPTQGNATAGDTSGAFLNAT